MDEGLEYCRYGKDPNELLAIIINTRVITRPMIREIIEKPLFLSAVLNAAPGAVKGFQSKDFRCCETSMKILVEFGVVNGFPDDVLPWQATNYIQYRDFVRMNAIYAMHVMRRRRSKDVGVMIARIVWSMRSVSFEWNWRRNE